MMENVNKWIVDHNESIKSVYHHLHSIAEVSWKEVETTSFLCSELERLGIDYETFPDQTGVIGYWGDRATGPVIGIRSDIDALFQNVNGVWKANHSCGHDAHMTMVLKTIECLKEIGFRPNGLIKIIFQPAEESGRGAQSIIEKGIIDDLDYLLGIHVRPIQEIAYGYASPAIYHGATTLLKGRIEGLAAHGARPNLGINVIDSFGLIIQAVNSIKIDPTVSASAKITMVKAGGDNLNIIPDYAEFGIDVRAERNDVMDDLIKKIEQAVLMAGTVNQAQVKIECGASMVAAEASPEFEKIVAEAIVEALGEEGFMPPLVTPGGEDFHFYKQSFPKLQATMVGLGTGLTPGLHHPNMSFNLDSLLNGIKIMSRTVVKLMSQTMD